MDNANSCKGVLSISGVMYSSRASYLIILLLFFWEYLCFFIQLSFQRLNFKRIKSPGSRDQMKGKSRPDPASPSSSLHQVGLAGKHRCVVCHVVVRGEHLHLVLARVDNKDHVFNGDAGLRDIGRKDDLEYLSSTCLSKICLDNNSA